MVWLNIIVEPNALLGCIIKTYREVHVSSLELITGSWQGIQKISPLIGSVFKNKILCNFYIVTFFENWV